jgi:spore germination cell wall hydrolase CwlJ-like protein
VKKREWLGWVCLWGLLFAMFNKTAEAAEAGEVSVRTDIEDVLKVEMSSRECLVYNLYMESRGESDLANIMVMNTVFNRVNSKHFPNTPCGVIKQRYQYSWTFDKRSDKLKDPKQVKRLTHLVDQYIMNRDMFLGMSHGVDHYHHVNITPEWSTSKRMIKVGVYDQHVFYRRD